MSTFCYINQSLNTVHVVLLNKKKKDSIWLQSYRVFLSNLNACSEPATILRRANRKRQFYFYGLAYCLQLSSSKNMLFAIE